MKATHGFNAIGAFGFNTKIGYGYGLTGSTVLAYILYSDPFTYTLDASGNTLMTNQGSFDDATVFSGSGVELQVDNLLPLPIPYTTGVDFLQSGVVTNAGGAILTLNGIDGYTVLSDGTSGSIYRPRIALVVSIGKSYTLTIRDTLNSGSIPDLRVFDGIDWVLYPKSLSYDIVFTATGGNPAIVYDGTVIFDITSIASIKETVASNENSFLTLVNGDGTVEQIDNSDNTPSTTYTLTNQTVLEATPTTAPFTAGDLALIEADTSLMGRLALGSTDTGLSLVTADVFGHYAMMEKEGAFCVDTIAPPSDNFFTDLAIRGSGTVIDNLDGSYDVTAPLSNSGATMNFASTTDPIITFYASNITGEMRIAIWTTSWQYQTIVEGYNSYRKGSGTSSLAMIDSTTSGSATIADIIVAEPMGAEITNYLDTVRTNIDFNSKCEIIRFERDGAGVPTAYNNTQMNWHGDGYADVQWNPSLAGNFWLEEIIGLVVYQHKYDGVNLTTYTDNVAGTPTAHTPENANYIVGKGVYPKVAADPYTTYVSPFFSVETTDYAEYDQAARYTILAAI